MAIPVSANLPQGVPPQGVQSTVLQLQPGQIVEARVVSNGQGNATQLAIGNQVVDASLQVKLQEGALIRLLVHATSPSLRLTVMPQQPAPALATGPQLSTPGPTPPTASASSQSVPAPQGSASGQAQALAQGQPAGQGLSIPQGTGRNAPLATSPTHAPATTQPSAAKPAALPGPVSTSQAPGVVSRGQTVSPALASVQVSAPATQGAAAAQSSAPVARNVPAQALPAGTVLQLQTSSSGAVLRPVLVPVSDFQQRADSGQGQRMPAQPGPALAIPPLQQAIIQTAQAAVARQDSISALIASLAGFGEKLSELPRPAAQAGGDLLGARLNLNGKPLDGAALKQAIQRSGVFLESALAKGAPPPQGDIKSALLKLVGALRQWVGAESSLKHDTANRPPPPTGGTPPRSERPVFSSPQPRDLPAREAGVRLHAQADAALSRLRLTQMSSLPEAFMRGGQGSGPPPELNVELPLTLGGEHGVGHFQILRDGKNGAERDSDGAWKMRFSVNFSQTGEVGATVSLRRQRVGVMLWAEREDIAEALEDAAGELQSALEARGLNPGAIRCRHGHPPQGKAPAGYFMDDCS